MAGTRRTARITRNRRAAGEIALPISRKPTGIGKSSHLRFHSGE
ncbi:hypothetical protein NBRC13296_20450 [Paenibacillus chitinolyticus]